MLDDPSYNYYFYFFDIAANGFFLQASDKSQH